MTRLMRIGLLVLLCGVCCATAWAANALPWRVPSYTLTARAMPLRQALETFSVAEGIPIVISDQVQGSFSGNFANVPAVSFLDRLATAHNFVWYYDGATIFVYASGEVVSTLIDLAYLKADDVQKMLAELGVEDARFPIRRASEGELLMVSGPPRYVQLVAQTVAKADLLKARRTSAQIETRLFPLKHAWADNVSLGASSPENDSSIRGVAQLLEEIVLGDASQQGRAAADTSVTNAPADRMVRQADDAFRPVIRAENRLNAVIVRDVVSRMPMYEKLIAQLDVPVPMVEIGITVVEMTAKDALDWGLSLKVAGQRGEVEGAAGMNPGQLFDSGSLAGNGLAAAGSYIGKRVSVNASLSALRERDKLRNIRRTSILTLNNLAAEMTDTQTNYEKVEGERVASLESYTGGTTLRLKPHLVKSLRADVKNQIWLTIDLDDGDTGTLNTRSSKVETSAGMFEGESLVLAGRVTDKKEKSAWGIPWLRDLPWIGWIFGGGTDSTETIQRVYILTPTTVTMDVQDLALKQTARQLDLTHPEDVENVFHASDEDRKVREQENDANRERRTEEAEDRLERRKREIARDRDLRQVERARAARDLKYDREDWAQALQEAKALLREEDARMSAERAKK